jgi:hypothetical protein
MVGGYTSRERHIFNVLYSIDFTWSIDMDENRAYDGLKLREDFGIDLGDKPCSMLEMMVALAIREDDIMAYYNSEDDSPKTWFWEMLGNCGIRASTPDDKIIDILNSIIIRDYGSCGEGGLFYVPEPRRDLKEVDIWYQMQWHLAQCY